MWTDHKNLTYYRTLKRLTPRQVRWQCFLSLFNIELAYKPGTKLIVPDLLSWRPDHERAEDPVETLFPNAIFVKAVLLEPITHDTLLQGQTNNPELQNLKEIAKSKPAALASNISLSKSGLILWNDRIWVPDPETQLNIITCYHDSPAYGHPGIF